LAEARFLGKNGEITGLMKQMGAVAKEDRPAFGAAVNDANRKVEKQSSEKMSGLTNGINLPPGMKLPF
jgi:phenylalanyl-tRNA synthetase alpha subunit